MEQMKYDVFISYSRKDYIRDVVIIPHNPITAILELFDKNNISYWFDKEGIYSGQEFIEVISNAIANSKMLVFVSSMHSNASMWTAGEVFEALDGEKLIIPVRIDDSPYNKKFKMLVRPLDYVDFQEQPKTALPQLLRAVLNEKERLAKIEKEEKLQLIEKQKEAKKEATRKEIKEKAKEYLALSGQQDYILKELYTKNKFIGNTTKRCLVCEKEVQIDSLFCDQCGWQFPKLYGIDGSDVPLHDESHLALVRKNWHAINSAIVLQKENDSLKETNVILSEEHQDLKKQYDVLKQKMSLVEQELKETEEKLSEGKRIIEEERKKAEEKHKLEEEAKRKAEEAKRQEEQLGKTFTVNGVSFKMIHVKGGTFMMGATKEQSLDAWKDEKPVHQVTLSDYHIGETVVTQILWQAVMGDNPSNNRGADYPVEHVSWDECQKFISILSAKTGTMFRLPTEAEWEFAARGGIKSKGYKYSGSNNINDVARYVKNSCCTYPVKTKNPNELGLYDMSGNVWEWCQDVYGIYTPFARGNPSGAKFGFDRVLRGGSWRDSSESCRTTCRDKRTPSSKFYDLGLRLAL